MNCIGAQFSVSKVEFENELLALQADEDIVRRSRVATATELWQEIDRPNMRKVYAQLLCMFGSTYTCEQTFSVMNYVKNKAKNRLTDFNLEAELRCAVTSLTPNISQIVKRGLCRFSSNASSSASGSTSSFASFS